MDRSFRPLGAAAKSDPIFTVHEVGIAHIQIYNCTNNSVCKLIGNLCMNIICTIL